MPRWQVVNEYFDPAVVSWTFGPWGAVRERVATQAESWERMRGTRELRADGRAFISPEYKARQYRIQQSREAKSPPEIP